MASNTSGVYHPRNPTDSPLWNVLNNHYDDFEKHYEEKYEKKYGYFRPVINEVVTEYLKCGDLVLLKMITKGLSQFRSIIYYKSISLALSLLNPTLSADISMITFDE